MIKKIVENRIRFTMLAYLIVTLIFLISNFFSFFWMVKFGISVLYIVGLFLIHTFSKKGLPGFVFVSAYTGIALLSYGLIYLTWILDTAYSQVDFKIIQSGIILATLLYLILTKLPKKLRSRVDQYIQEKGYGISNTEPILMTDVKVASKYAAYTQKRWQRITNGKPMHLTTQNLNDHSVRIVFAMMCWMTGLIAIIYGITEYKGDNFLLSLNFIISALGLAIVIFGVAYMMSGVIYGLKVMIGAIGVIVLISVIVSNLMPLYQSNQALFYGFMSVLIICVGIGLAVWVRQILITFTLGLTVYSRENNSLGVDLLLRDNLPIEHYNSMIMVEITVDEAFDFNKLMHLGPKIELHAIYGKYPFTGLHILPNKHLLELYFITRNPNHAQRKLKIFLNRHFHYPHTVSVLNDPIKIIDERLMPTVLEILEIKNRNTILNYDPKKLDLSIPYSIIVVINFNDVEKASAAKVELEKEDFNKLILRDTRKYQDEDYSNWNGWLVLALQIETRIGLERMNILTRLIHNKITPYQGVLSHWFIGQFKEETTDELEVK